MDLAVRCNYTGFYSFESQPNAPYHDELAKTTAVFEGPLFGILVSGATVAMDVPRHLPDRPFYLPDLRNTLQYPAMAHETLPVNKLALTFQTIGGPFSFGPPYPPMQINGKAFSDKDDFIHM